MSAPDHSHGPGGNLLIAVITHTAPGTLREVLSALREEPGPPHILVLFTGGPASRHLPAAQKAAADYGTAIFLTPTAQRIGAARAWLMTRLPSPAGRHPAAVAFLDDDCVPRPGWHAAARSATTGQAALVFGPRFPGRISGLGARVRAAEAARSRKLRAGSVLRPVPAPRMLVAGGNMIVSLRAARRLGITRPAFADGAFEDVDLQLRAQARDERVEYWPGLAVDHHDTLTAWGLLRKSALSGAGMAACAAHHGHAFWQCCRWRPARLLARRLAPAIAAILCATALPAGRLLPILIGAALTGMAAAAYAPARRGMAVSALRSVRDTVLALSYVAERTHLAIPRLRQTASRRTPDQQPTPG